MAGVESKYSYYTDVVCDTEYLASLMVAFAIPTLYSILVLEQKAAYGRYASEDLCAFAKRISLFLTAL